MTLPICLNEWRIRRAVGEAALTVTINPLAITDELQSLPAQLRRLSIIGRPYPDILKRVLLRVSFELAPFILQEAAFDRASFAHSKVYRRMQDIYEHRARLSASQTFQEIVQEIERNGEYRHKEYIIRDASQTEEFLRACYLDILVSMATEGYLIDKNSPFATGGTGNAVIDRDGKILKGPGATHRLAAARIVKLDQGFPLRIVGIHADFARRNDAISNPRKIEKVIRSVEEMYAKQPISMEL